MTTALEARDIVAGYGRNHVLDGAGLDVGAGEIVGVVGHNGAGKTTLLKAIYGLVPIARGTVLRDGRDITRARPEEHLRYGIGYVPQERNVFSNLSVEDNLRLGGVLLTHEADHRPRVAARIDYVYGLFPQLAERRRQLAGSMSGGEQRMVAIGMGLMLTPRVLLLDEPTTGLAPIFVAKLVETIARLNREDGLAVVMVEQNIVSLLKIAQRVFVIRSGRSSAVAAASLSEREIWAIL